LRLLRFDHARAQFERARAVHDTGSQPDLVMAAHTRLGLIDSAVGDFARAERAFDRVRTDRVHAVSRERQLASATGATVAAARGRFDHAERLASEAIALYRLHEYLFTLGIAYPVFVASRTLRGDLQGALAAIDAWADEGARGTWRYRALVEAWTRGPGGVDPQVASRPWRLPAEVDIFTVDLPCIHIELARVLERLDVVEAALAMLEEVYERGCRFTIGWPWSVGRMIGESWLLLDKPDEAIRWFSIAESECDRADARFEGARASLGLARSAALQGHSSDAMAHARRAAVALDGIGALDLARQARVLCNETASDHQVLRPALRAILVTDLGDSTAINARSGDALYVQMLSEHDRLIRRRLAEHSGVEFKHTGDGLCAWFASAGDAVFCALGIRDDLEQLASVEPEVRLAVRTGIAAGEPVDAGDDLFGLAVVVATRVCNLASPGQVYVAEEVTQLTRGKPLAFQEIGSFPLKGLPGTTTVFEALRP
jgi:class 3 adenylate cyclase